MFTYIKRIALFLVMNIAILALLSVIMGIIGYLFPELLSSFGGYGIIMIYAVIMGFIGSFISLFLSKWMAKKAYNIVLLDDIDALKDDKLTIVQSTVARIAQIEHITMPEVGYYESAEPNAFATGATKNTSLVAVSTGLLNHMNKAEIEGVIGHEMAHIINGDMVTLTLLQGVMNTFVIFLSHVASRFVAGALSRDGDGETVGYLAYNAIYILFQMIFGFLAMFIIMGFSRIREYRADLGGARFTSKSNMIAGLKKLQSLSQIPPSSTHGTMTAFMIHEKDSFFSTHPTLENRIQALENNYSLR